MHSLESHTYVEDVTESAEFQFICYPPCNTHIQAGRQASKDTPTIPALPFSGGKKETTGWSPHCRQGTEV